MGLEGLGRRWAGISVASRLIMIIVVAAVALIAVLRMGVQPASSGDGEGCQASGAVVTRDVAEESVLIPRLGRLVTFSWVFDADTAHGKEKTLLDWQLPTERPASIKLGDQLAVSFASALKSQDGEVIPRGQTSASAVVTADGVELSVCVDSTDTPPDRYTTTVVFDDQQVKVAPLGVDVTVKHRAAWVPLSAMVIGLALAFVVLVLSLADDDSVRPGRIVGLALAALLVAAGTARPWEAWQENPTWGKGLFDAPTLAAATALAFTGAMVASTTITGIRTAATEAGATEKGDDGGSADDGADGAPEHDDAAPRDEETV